MPERFGKFSERARRVLELAQQEARHFNHNYIGTEHLLLGLVSEGEGVAAKVLANLGVKLEAVRSAVEFIIGRGDVAVTHEIGLTPRAKKVIELDVDEARRLNHGYIGTEHLLLGLVREGEGIAAGVLESLGATLERVRAETTRALQVNQVQQAPPASATGQSVDQLLARAVSSLTHGCDILRTTGNEDLATAVESIIATLNAIMDREQTTDDASAAAAAERDKLLRRLGAAQTMAEMARQELAPKHEKEIGPPLDDIAARLQALIDQLNAEGSAGAETQENA